VDLAINLLCDGSHDRIAKSGRCSATREISAIIEHALSDKPGEWRVSIAGSRASENWEMRIEGANGFERSYTLTGADGGHEPESIRRLILQLLPSGSL
jgi:hypothetical protein